MGLTVNITPDESKMLRKLFSKKAESTNLREEGIEGGKRKKDEASEDGSARKMRYQGSSKKAENADEIAAAQQDLGASVQFLLLDQIVPKKLKDGGAARLFGKTRRGTSVVVWVKDFRPYFFFPAPTLENDQPLSSAHLIQMCIDLNERCGDKNCSSPVLGITIEDHTELYYYRSKGPSPYLRVSLEAHEKMNKVALALEKMSSSQNPSIALPLRWPAACEPWETNISAQMRFFSDLSISGGSWIEVPARQAMQSKTTRCGLELECSFLEVKSLTHDIADNIFAASCSHKPRGNEQDVAPLTVMSLAVIPIPATRSSTPKTPQASAEKDAVGIIACLVSPVYATNAFSSPPRSVVFVNLPQSSSTPLPFSLEELEMPCLEKADIRFFNSENACLCAWLEWAVCEDADCWATFEAQHSLGYLEQRASALGLPFDCGRVSGASTKLRSVQSYSRQWAAHSRIGASLETFKADNLSGRVFFDMLRLTSTKLKDEFHTSSLGEVVRKLLNRPHERLSQEGVAQLYEGGRRGLMRLAATSVLDAQAILDLFSVLSSIPDCVEMSRVTGLSLQDILFKAEMVKVHSMLLRVAHRHSRNYILPSSSGGGSQITEGPFKIDPREAKTAGFYPEYKDSAARGGDNCGAILVCDFQSLYPSVIIANNLCYSTLLYDTEEIQQLGEDKCKQAPGATAGKASFFVSSSVLPGLFPALLDKLLALRVAAKDELKKPDLPHIARMALEGRQRALKLCANACYGFAGAATSPVQSVPLAEAVLLHGAAVCRRAIGLAQAKHTAEVLEVAAMQLGQPRVIYAQTDSLFVLLPRATLLQADAIGRKLALHISKAIDTAPVKLNYETALSNFLLQAVNRYAAKTMHGTLLAKGVETDRRDVPGILRRITSEALQTLLVDDDADKCVRVCAEHIRVLLRGKSPVSDLIMTGALVRYTGKDIRNEAQGQAAGGRAGEGEGGSGAAAADDATGPAAKVAVKMVARNPRRSFAAGERVPFVYLAGQGTQQDRAEDPLFATLHNLPLDYQLYWSNKIQQQLKRLLEPALSKQQLQELFNGPHTKVKGTVASTAQGKMGSFFKPAAANCGAAKTPEKVRMQEQEAAMKSAMKSAAEHVCRKCQADAAGELLCCNTSCENLFERLRLAKLEW